MILVFSVLLNQLVSEITAIDPCYYAVVLVVSLHRAALFPAVRYPRKTTLQQFRDKMVALKGPMSDKTFREVYIIKGAPCRSQYEEFRRNILQDDWEVEWHERENGLLGDVHSIFFKKLRKYLLGWGCFVFITSFVVDLVVALVVDLVHAHSARISPITGLFAGSATTSVALVGLFPRQPQSNRLTNGLGTIVSLILVFGICLAFVYVGVERVIGTIGGPALPSGGFGLSLLVLTIACVLVVQMNLILQSQEHSMSKAFLANMISGIVLLFAILFGLWLLHTVVQQFLWVASLIVAYPLMLAAFRLPPDKWTEKGVIEMYRMGLNMIPVIGQLVFGIHSKPKTPPTKTPPTAAPPAPHSNDEMPPPDKEKDADREPPSDQEGSA